MNLLACVPPVPAVIHSAAHSQLQPFKKDFGYSLSIGDVSTAKALWTSIKLPSQVCERKKFCLPKGSERIKKCHSLLFSAGTVDCRAPSTRLILWLPVRVTKHCCFHVCFPAAGFRGTTGRAIQSWKNREIRLITLQTLFVSGAQGHAFLLQILVLNIEYSADSCLEYSCQEYWFHYQKLYMVVFGFGWAFFVFIRIPNKRCLPV